MGKKHSLERLLVMSSIIAIASGCVAPDGEDIGLGAAAVVTPSDLAYDPIANTFSRTVIREIQTSNPKQFPFRVEEGQAVTVVLEWLPPPTGSGWIASRPSTYALRFSDDGETWTNATPTTPCTQTASSGSAGPFTCTFTAGATTGYALIDVSTTTASGNVNNKAARFGLTYTFTGPADVYESEAPSTVSQTVTGITSNSVQKATVDGVNYPGVLEGQGVELVIERSHANVEVEPNGPKLKDRVAAHAQYDGLDFDCGPWVPATGAGQMICTLEGAATRDSLIHVPFKLNNTSTAGRWATVTVNRSYVNGYVRQ